MKKIDFSIKFYEGVLSLLARLLRLLGLSIYIVQPTSKENSRR